MAIDPHAVEVDVDRALFEGVRDRDPAAWERFVRRFGPIVRAAARRSGVTADQLEDVEQSTWSLLLRHAALIREPHSLPGWVVTTATREAWRVLRRDGRREQVEELRSEDRDETVAAADAASLRLELVQHVRDGLERLDERCGALLRALFLERETPSYEELSERLGMPFGSLGPTRQRCLAKLGRDLERRGIALDDE